MDSLEQKVHLRLHRIHLYNRRRQKKMELRTELGRRTQEHLRGSRPKGKKRKRKLGLVPEQNHRIRSRHQDRRYGMR